MAWPLAPRSREGDEMTQDFWWFALVGFLIGFVLSTLWEWLHFRSKRMRIQNRRIAELEAALRSAQAQINTASPPAPNPWPATDFLGPAVYLETEGAVIGPGAPAMPPVAQTPVTRDTNPVLTTTAAALTAVAVTKALTDDADAYDADGKEASAMVAADAAASADPQLMASEAPAAEAVTPPAAVADQVESGHDAATTPPEGSDGANGKRLAAAALAAGAARLGAGLTTKRLCLHQSRRRTRRHRLPQLLSPGQQRRRPLSRPKKSITWWAKSRRP